MVDAKFLKPDTLALHAGQHPDPVTGARAVPIYQTTSFVFRDVDHAASLFNLEVGGHIYSRISNPTVAVFEERVAALEEGSGALGVSSGQAALHIAIATLMGAGGHIVASTSLYGGTRNMLGLTLPRFGITTTFVNPRDHDGFAKAITPATRLVLGETIGNPGGEVLDIPAIAEIAHAAKIPLMIDNTFASPVLCRPLTLGADIVFHSATKFIGGHGVAIGGVIVECGRFDWEALGQVPDPDRALCRLSRHRLRRGVRPACLHHARPRRGRARLRLLPGAAERLLPAAGPRDPAAARRAPRRECAQGDRLPQEQSRGRAHRLARAARSSRPRAGQEAAAQGHRLDLLASTSRAAARRAGASSSG